MTDPSERSSATPQDEDTRLMLAFQNGSVRAFEELVRRNQGRLFRLALRYVTDPGGAEDIVQEAFIRVHQSASQWKPTAKVGTWLHRITCNLCLNWIRDRKTRREVDPQGKEAEPDQADHHNPLQDLEMDELASAVESAVAELPESQRIVLILRRYQELSYEEIAAVTGQSTSAVKSLLSRARQTLKEQLRRHIT